MVTNLHTQLRPNIRGLKYSLMAPGPRKPRQFNPRIIWAHTVCAGACTGLPFEHIAHWTPTLIHNYNNAIHPRPEKRYSLPPPPLYTLPIKGVGQDTVSNQGYFRGWKTVKMGWDGQPNGRQPWASIDGRPGRWTAPGRPDAVAATAGRRGHPVSARRIPGGAVVRWSRRVEGHGSGRMCWAVVVSNLIRHKNRVPPPT